ncbi:MAG: zinc ribbon domain-containing protein [Thaumarchaeota archaeon]|nr:zinc ribbon domain-containing protein [Nitrososphaerota archaeon]MCL5318668.1 zinc ribbon domain-containing protein [Nitrososphaerota archaeon]
MRENYEARTARSYALVGFIFYVLGALTSLLGAFGYAFFMGSGMMGGFAPSFFPFFPSAFLIISSVLAVWSWVTLNNIDAGRYQEAQTASLVLGILGIFFAWLIGGIFFLLAYGRLSYAIRHPHATLKSSVPTEPTVAPPATGARFCPECGSAVSESDRFCRNCGKTL